MPSDLGDSGDTITYFLRQKPHKLLTRPLTRHHPDPERGEQTRNLDGLVGRCEGVRDREPLGAAIAVGDADVRPPVFLARIPGQGQKVDPRRADRLPDVVTIFVDLKDEDT